MKKYEKKKKKTEWKIEKKWEKEKIKKKGETETIVKEKYEKIKKKRERMKQLCPDLVSKRENMKE